MKSSSTGADGRYSGSISPRLPTPHSSTITVVDEWPMPLNLVQSLELPGTKLTDGPTMLFVRNPDSVF